MARPGVLIGIARSSLLPQIAGTGLFHNRKQKAIAFKLGRMGLCKALPQLAVCAGATCLTHYIWCLWHGCTQTRGAFSPFGFDIFHTFGEFGSFRVKSVSPAGNHVGIRIGTPRGAAATQNQHNADCCGDFYSPPWKRTISRTLAPRFDRRQRSGCRPMERGRRQSDKAPRPYIILSTGLICRPIRSNHP
jgi:hypothetical protein